MADLLDQESVDEFRAALRDVTDTFHRFPVTLRRADNSEVDLLAGAQPDTSGDNGQTSGELAARDDRSDVTKRWVVTFHRDYLAEQGLIGADKLLFGFDDWIMIGGKRFAIVELTDRAVFRDQPILVRLVVER